MWRKTIQQNYAKNTQHEKLNKEIETIFFFFNSGAGDTVNEMKNARGSINNRKDQEEFVK